MTDHCTDQKQKKEFAKKFQYNDRCSSKQQHSTCFEFHFDDAKVFRKV